MNNLDLMRARLEWEGGIRQEDRMIKNKWRTLQRALNYSYQGCFVQMVQSYAQVLNAELDQMDPDMSVFPIVRALINPDKVKQDYDDKIISIDYKHQYQPGDVFEWVKTGTQWIIYTQEITEDAYFRGEIRRCRYKIKFKDQEGNWCSTWAAIRGPVETQITPIQKNQQRIDEPNLSLNILMPRNEKTLQAFDRYSKFLFAGKAWRVEAPDSISTKNIIEISAEEYYINKETDDVENEIAGGLIIEPVVTPDEDGIQGEGFIKPKIAETYRIEESDGKWTVLEDVPVTIYKIDANTVTVTWNKMVSGQFTLQWAKDGKSLEKTVVVESLY